MRYLDPIPEYPITGRSLHSAEDLKFTLADPEATVQLLEDWLDPPGLRDITTIRVASLAFFDDYKLYAVTYRGEAPRNNTRLLLHRNGDALPLNWSNEPIYEAVRRSPAKLNENTVIPYAKFFFRFVRGRYGPFVIVEKAEHITWQSSAPANQKSLVNLLLEPVTYRGRDGSGLATLSATILFKTSLFKVDIKIATRECNWFNPQTMEWLEMLHGETKLLNEEELVRGLHISVDEPPPGELGYGSMRRQSRE